jgi:hypothetical protein
MKTSALVFICFIGSFLGFAQKLKLSTKEEKLYQEILEYRRKNRLPPFALSKALTCIAKSHVEDLDVRESTSDSNFNIIAGERIRSGLLAAIPMYMRRRIACGTDPRE